MQMILYFAATMTVFLLVALLMAPVLLRRTPEAQRLMDVVVGNKIEEKKVVLDDQWKIKLLESAHNLRAKLGFSENPKLKARLAQAGFRDASTADIFFAAQFLVPITAAVIGSFAPDNTLFVVLVCAVVGYMAPDMWLTRKTDQRKNKIRRSMPDAMDLLVICVDAGLGMDQALLRVGEELALSHPEINQEFTQVNLAQRAGQPRLEAWQALAERTKIEEFTQFVNMLTQTDRFGTPIAKALNRFSEELRMKRRQHAEEQASKTKIKIIFPLVLCIFPCIFIVLLAPAVLSIASGLKGMGN